MGLEFYLPNVPLRIFGDMSDSDHINLKVQLRNRLNSGQLLKMPAGFPFRYVFDGHGDSYITSGSSFEFQEDFLVSSPNERPRYQNATISYTSAERKGRDCSWQVFFSSRDPSYCRGSTGKYAVAHVQVEAPVIATRYGRALRLDPSYILKALAVSLEAGVHITIKLANSPVPLPRPTRNPGPLMADSVVYVARYNDGREDILFVCPQPRP
ncbi:hypothetical protein BDZ94DRAFT_1276611 [Collybia nuda]|uniref:Uncharacterized protein n=1 Tax=Collybia nuda TaxID=64659 RepID=A0A9P6CC69_9AGAR|nr:hypothetical protein BDZ94DRAFT_537032 [Collybia nuda]KAF9456059.1 hypothetical protein BDZ94DRAFT_1276611 [Collybia nuda]